MTEAFSWREKNKVAVLGALARGKIKLVPRLCGETVANDESNFYTLDLRISRLQRASAVHPEEQLELTLFDLEIPLRGSDPPPSHARDAMAAVCIYDADSPSTLERLSKLFRDPARMSTAKILVGVEKGGVDGGAVSEATGRAFAETAGADFFLIRAATGYQVSGIIDRLFQLAEARLELELETKSGAVGEKLKHVRSSAENPIAPSSG
eukprot:m.195718 g.195718  ORF g.195718 m.195718 type:complete len:209 (-) comp53727_c0_seq3:1210-1836(-)